MGAPEQSLGLRVRAIAPPLNKSLVFGETARPLYSVRDSKNKPRSRVDLPWRLSEGGGGNPGPDPAHAARQPMLLYSQLPAILNSGSLFFFLQRNPREGSLGLRFVGDKFQRFPPSPNSYSLRAAIAVAVAAAAAAVTPRFEALLLSPRLLSSRVACLFPSHPGVTIIVFYPAS